MGVQRPNSKDTYPSQFGQQPSQRIDLLFFEQDSNGKTWKTSCQL